MERNEVSFHKFSIGKIMLIIILWINTQVIPAAHLLGISELGSLLPGQRQGVVRLVPGIVRSINKRGHGERKGGR